MPADTSEGRKKARASAALIENDQAEREESLEKVEARDLLRRVWVLHSPQQDNRNPKSIGFRFDKLNRIGICWKLSRFSSIP